MHGPFTFTVQAGECLCISGASGAGKSVLLRAIADLDPHQGEMFVDDLASNAMSANQWRTHVAYLTAESVWWHDVVAPHFTSPPLDRLDQLGLEHNILQRAVTQCSTGERQRLALLRILQNKPGVLLLDEPTASLDDENTARVEALLADYRKQHHAAIVWISHSPQQQKRVADRVMLLENQQLTELAK